jgi:hypothetical protein
MRRRVLTVESESLLVWNPVSRAVEKQIQSGDKLLLVISPFIKQGALESILSNGCLSADAKVIVRWRPEDICSQVSDVDIYPVLTDQRIPLYRNDQIHLKLYVFESNLAFHTSGNLTNRGFGYSDRQNVEVGGFVHLRPEDWARIYWLIESSTLVDDELFAIFQAYASSCPTLSNPVPSLKIPEDTKKPYSIYSLPASEQPELICSYYESGWCNADDPETERRIIHDLGLYKMPLGLNGQKFMELLSTSFCAHPFIQDLVAFIQEKKTLRFGTVNNWIHNHCSDVPLPYRWELKENTRILYNWLDYFFEEICWDVPGARSQVISWRDEAG